MPELKLFAVHVRIDNSVSHYSQCFHVFAATAEDAKRYVAQHVDDPWTYIEKYILVQEIRVHAGMMISGNKIY